MAASYATFGSYILFKEVLVDELGHLYRAGEFSAKGVKRTVWLRVFDGPGVPAADVSSGFSTGRKVAGILQAANVASGVVFLEENGVPAMAFDYTPGQPLAALFSKVHQEGFPVPVDNALLIMEKLALGISSGLVVDVSGKPLSHGLLHPGMAVVTNDGEAIVAGFGIADQLLGLLDEPQSAEKIKPYLSPEVINNRTADKWGDVYSLGAILFELLTGTQLPSDPGGRPAVLDGATMSYDGEPIPGDIKALLARATAPRMEDRFSSAADFKKELDKLLYGGNYSPTTFNLALFMDRLFRDEIEATEKERAAEAAVDVEPYLAPEPEPEPIESTIEQTPGRGKGMIYAIAASVAVVALAIAFVMTRGDKAPPPPTAEEIASQRAAQEEKIREMAARMVEETMKVKEAEIMSELEERQSRIESLQKKLEESQKRSSTAADKAKQEELQRQIAAEREEQAARQAALEEEKQRLLEEAKTEAEEQAKIEAAQPAVTEVAAAVATATPEPVAQPTVMPPTAPPKVPAATAVTVKENQFVEPTEVDARPAVIKEVPVDWPRMAMRSRRKGTVILQVTVNANGTVDDVKILRADESGFGIPEAVMDAVRQYRFKPGMKDGVKIKTYATVTQRYVFTR